MPNPSPANYKIKGQFGDDIKDQNVHFGPNKVFTFGVSRESMKPLHVDDINKQGKKGRLSPGPGAYKDQKTFSKDGLYYSFSAHLNAETIALKNSAKLPGPGSYAHADVLGRGVASSLKPNSVG